MLLLILLLISIFKTTHSYTAIMTLHFHSFGLDLSKIDCVHPFGNEYNRGANFRSVEPIRKEDDCQIYIRACSFGPTKTSCLRTASYSFMHNYTGGLAFSLEDKTKKSKAKIQFRSPDMKLDTYLIQNHEYLVEEVRSGNVMNNNTLKSANLRGSVQAMINCGEGYDLDFTKYFCEIDPHPLLPYVEVHEVVETEDGPIVTTMLVEKEDLYQVPVEFPATTALPSPPPLVLVPPMAMQPQQERLVHCKDESCGYWIIYVVITNIFFLFVLSAAVFCFVAKRSRDPSRRLHESTTIHSIRSRTSRSSVQNSPV
ncbi:hypothetical protein PRIPAC_95235 [Pristionchus pacificus]|uniref:Uncharacterized protein n=1 Tax=Pristionchus pacificus TaxID=54126 RepID=A0A2A6D116_PRIPA|nr:hypothetical protein PRIPAC_95235 [Pristionchus pacificus]|eukprot:PDM84154.1 hypothetical protein PRIPAC_34346 [Pristionchus pacificus]